MTKEQILKNNGLYIGFKSTYSWDCIIVSMQEYADQELSKEREKAKKLVEFLKEYEQWEADLIADNAMWWPSVPKDRISGKTYDTMLILQDKRNELIKSINF
jgi:hypothetical protein